MPRRPLLPERLTYLLAIMGSILTFVAVTSVTESMLPRPAAIALGAVLFVLALVAIPALLGRPEASPIIVAAVGGLAVLVGFGNSLDGLGMGRALLVFVPIAVALGVLIWLTQRYVAAPRRRAQQTRP